MQFKTLTSKCAALSDERDALRAEQQKRDDEARIQLEREEAESAALKRRLDGVEEQRQTLHDRCVELEKRLDNDISLYYRGGDAEGREGGKRDDLQRLVVRYRESLRLVVDQLRHTADFLATRVSGGSANAEIDELVARIQAMQAELEDASNLSQRLLGETRRESSRLWAAECRARLQKSATRSSGSTTSSLSAWTRRS